MDTPHPAPGRYWAKCVILSRACDVDMVRQLQPWYANLKKRQVKAPKVYIRDSGLLHTLLGIHSTKDLLEHPKVGASWEGYVIENLIAASRAEAVYFWATHGGAELDLLLVKEGRRTAMGEDGVCVRASVAFLPSWYRCTEIRRPTELSRRAVCTDKGPTREKREALEHRAYSPRERAMALRQPSRVQASFRLI